MQFASPNSFRPHLLVTGEYPSYVLTPVYLSQYFVSIAWRVLDRDILRPPVLFAAGVGPVGYP